MIGKIESITRYVVCSGVTKRPIFNFVSSVIRPDHAVFVFAFEDDYSFGIMQSYSHWLWFVTKCSKLKSDFRYTPPTVFDTFPWPQSPSAAEVLAVAKAGRQIRAAREHTLSKIKGGLRAVYRELMDTPGKNALKDAHAALDEAVMRAYGFSAKKDLLAQLLELNREVAGRIERGEAVTAPGIPAGYPNPESLVSEDCVRPRPL
ncbi:MAG: hypothetical protein RLZZ303_1888 [Candidatus Hydrogenedentota bacterium]|jgi:hypothetical protein